MLSMSGPAYTSLIRSLSGASRCNRFRKKVLAAVCRNKAGRIIDYYPASWNWVDDLDECGKDEADAIDKAIFDALNRPFLRIRPWIW
jgi:hypothetical protein